MFSGMKEVLTKEIDVKELLTKEVDIKKFLEMEIELTKLKEVLATEIKLKEFLVQEIDLGNFLSDKSVEKSTEGEKSTPQLSSESVQLADIVINNPDKTQNSKRNLPAYDYGLIKLLDEEHKKIRFIFNQIMSNAIAKKYTKVATHIDRFNKEMRDHYHKADIELYAYLKTYVQIKYPKREKAFTQLSLEMKNISIEIFYIISQSPNLPLSDRNYAGFMKEFMVVGKLLNERINREKSLLFKMYQQTNEAKSIS